MVKKLEIVQVSPECLETMIANAVSKGFEKLKETFSKSPQSESYLTRDEVATKLKISKGTLDNWTKEGKISSHKVRGKRRVFFKESEIEKFVNQNSNDDEKS